MNSTIMVDLMPGTVTYQIRCSRLAPSILAASYNSELMPVMAARKMMLPQPASFQILLNTTIGRK
ncbi:hypothetical protein D3C76_1379610 [compost metagenome]